MEKLKYKSSDGSTEILVGSSWENVKSLVDSGKTVIITDSNLSALYGKDFPDCPVLTVSPGEQAKSLATVEAIIKDLLKLEVDRSFFLLGIGGGVVCDLTGFVASIYMRGIDFGFVASSLLAQVDASTGGKNGVNSAGFKNVVGCFTQPQFVICDPKMLKTLDKEEFRSGLGELVKHSLLTDKALFAMLEKSSSELNPDNEDLLQKLIAKSIKIKIAIVEEDEKERAKRRLLNLGHTIGHAIESVRGIKHGLAISEGIYYAALLSKEKGYLSDEDFERIVGLMQIMGLVKSTPVMQRAYIDKVSRDKKREKDVIHFVMLKGIGKGFIEEIKLDDLSEWMKKQL